MRRRTSEGKITVSELSPEVSPLRMEICSSSDPELIHNIWQVLLSHGNTPGFQLPGLGHLQLDWLAECHQAAAEINYSCALNAKMSFLKKEEK